MAWIGGALVQVSDQQLVLKEADGARVTLDRLAQGATAVYQASAGAWVRIDPDTGLDQGQQACVETLLSGRNLLALRVFLGADCGPAV